MLLNISFNDLISLHQRPPEYYPPPLPANEQTLHQYLPWQKRIYVSAKINQIKLMRSFLLLTHPLGIFMSSKEFVTYYVHKDRY